VESISEQINYNLFIKEILPQLLMDSIVQFSKDVIKNPKLIEETLKNNK
jgi:hypothetical protein